MESSKAAQVWYVKLTEALKSTGFEQCQCDTSLYVHGGWRFNPAEYQGTDFGSYKDDAILAI